MRYIFHTYLSYQKIIQMLTAIITIVLLVLYLKYQFKISHFMREDKLYLTRYSLFNVYFFSAKIHVIHKSDPEEPHDHPWNYVSIILKGGYWEVTNSYPRALDVLKWHKPGSILFRNGNKLHRLVVPVSKKCVSLILCSKKYRDWGFLKGYKWTSHKECVY